MNVTLFIDDSLKIELISSIGFLTGKQKKKKNVDTIFIQKLEGSSSKLPPAHDAKNKNKKDISKLAYFTTPGQRSFV